MIIDINIQEGSKEYEILMKNLNRLKDRNDINFDIYKDRKAFTTDIDVYYVAEEIFFDIERECDIDLLDDEKDDILETVSYKIFNKYDYSDYNDYIADLVREYSIQAIEERKEIAIDLLNTELSIDKLYKLWKEVLEPWDLDINPDGGIIYDDEYVFEQMLRGYFMKINPVNKDEELPKEFNIIFKMNNLSKVYKIESIYNEDDKCILLLKTLKEIE